MSLDDTRSRRPDADDDASRRLEGARLGPYRIHSLIGAGGMGEVWRAVDTRLGREVALKMLPTEVASDPERMARFEREAKVLASLNHPNIAVLYGLEHLDLHPGATKPGAAAGPTRVHALVMELVEGPGLDEVVTERPMSFDEAMPIVVQITRALQAAHECGVVHRDLKPANIKIRPDGTVKVLDFGLATPWQARQDGSQSLAPTMSGHHTAAGAMLGSAAYMSPEQTRGRPVDRRTDIWAFGCVLYEMLTGLRAFEGDSLSDTMASVLRDEPAWRNLPADLDPVARHVLRRCLAKDPGRRFHDIADVRIELEEAASVTVQRRQPTPRGRWMAAAALAAGAVGLGALAALLLGALGSGGGSMPSYRALTYRSGHVASARFAPDETTVVVGMSTAERPLALMATSTESIESRYLELPPADILGIADNGRMAVLLDRRREGSWVSVGTLAVADLVGGAPRPIADRVNDGDISPDGSELAVVREVGRIQRLEYPLGTTLFETSGWISHVRISPEGRRVAFLHHPHYGDDRGLVVVVEADGALAELTEELPDSVQGLAWAPDGASVWFSAYVFGQGGVVWSVKPGEPRRERLRSPISVRLRDISTDGRLLLVAGDSRAEIAGLLGDATRQRLYEGWNDDSLGGLSANGELFAGNMQVSTVDGEYAAFVRRADGSPAVLIGYGNVFGMSPDGRWVFTHKLASDRSSLKLLPTGAGSPRVVDLGGVVPVSSGAAMLTTSLDGRHAAFNGFDGDVGPRIWVLDTAGGAVAPVGPVGTRGAVISPDGTRVASTASDGRATVYDVSAGTPATIPSAQPGEEPLQWTRDGRSVLVWDRALPARIYRLGVSDGTRDLALEVMPPNPAGVLYGNILLTPGGEHYVYRYRRDVSTLYLVEGVR